MIEDVVICKFVAEHQTFYLQESNSDPGILCARSANCTQSGISMQAQSQMR